MLLTVLMGLYLAALLWMRRISAATPLPRFMGTTVADRQATS
jgi:hypothetical protein